MRVQLRRVFGVVVVAALACAGLALSGAPAGAVPTGFLVTEVETGCGLNSIDLATGDLQPIGAVSTDACVVDLALAPDGTLYGLRGRLDEQEQPDIVELVRFDTTTGAVTLVGQVGTFTAALVPDFGGLVVDQAGRMFASIVPEDPAATTVACQELDAYCLYRVDPANPASVTFVGQMPDAATDETIMGALAASCEGAAVTSRELDESGAAFVPDPQASATESVPSVADELDEPAGAGSFELDNIDLSTAVSTTVGPFGHLVLGFDFDAGGVLWGVGFATGGSSSVFTIDRATGVATPTVALEGGASPRALAIAKTCPTTTVIAQPTFTG